VIYTLISTLNDDAAQSIWAWRSAMRIAVAFGWSPAGTGSPDDTDSSAGELWNGSYMLNAGQRFLPSDAAPFATALFDFVAVADAVYSYLSEEYRLDQMDELALGYHGGMPPEAIRDTDPATPQGKLLHAVELGRALEFDPRTYVDQRARVAVAMDNLDPMWRKDVSALADFAAKGEFTIW
jgi:hypothetical protein